MPSVTVYHIDDGGMDFYDRISDTTDTDTDQVTNCGRHENTLEDIYNAQTKREIDTTGHGCTPRLRQPNTIGDIGILPHTENR